MTSDSSLPREARRPRLRFLVLLPGALLACSPGLAPPPAEAPATAHADAIAQDPQAIARIEADIRYLASPELAGRGTGEEGAHLAASYIEARFAELGLVPFGAPRPGGVPRGFTQAFDAKVGASVDPPRAILDRAGKQAILGPGSIVTAEGSASGEVSAEVVLVGYGIAAPAVGWDDYAGRDVEGKIVVVLDGTPASAIEDDPQRALRDFGGVRYKLRTAREHKAAGALIVTHESLPPEPSDATSMGVIGVVAKQSAAAGLLTALGASEEGAWRYPKPGSAPVKSARRPMREPPRVTLTTRITPVVAPAWNVVAMLPAAPGSAKASEYVVVGAHYDHLGHGGTASRAPGVRAVHPGADDNASGTALVLEAARRLSKLARKPQRNVLFMAFGAEEIGALGSRYWVDHPPVDVGSVVAMINADMVGRLRDRRLLVDGVGTAAGWNDLLRAADAGLGLDLSLGAEGFGASDHASFTAARVPVAFLFTGVHDDYHLPSDTADRINFEGVAEVTTLAARLALAVADRPDRLAFVDAPADPHRGMRGGFNVSLGTIPDYAYDGPGVRLTGTRPDAPAARAGMTAGDVLVRVGPHAITNIHDYVFALGELEPGREVEIEIVRDKNHLVLKVIPAPGR